MSNAELKTPQAAHDLTKLEAILAKYPCNESSLIMVLQDVQEEYRYLPSDVMVEVAKELGLPKSKVFAVGTFYKTFSFEPKGRHNVKVCMGTACHVRGSSMVLESLERELGLKGPGNTADLEYTLETVNCVGACGMAPVVMVDEKYFAEVKPEKVKKLLKKEVK